MCHCGQYYGQTPVLCGRFTCEMCERTCFKRMFKTFLNFSQVCSTYAYQLSLKILIKSGWLFLHYLHILYTLHHLAIIFQFLSHCRYLNICSTQSLILFSYWQHFGHSDKCFFILISSFQSCSTDKLFSIKTSFLLNHTRPNKCWLFCGEFSVKSS